MEPRWLRVLLIVAGTLVALTDVGYILLINAQGVSPQPYIPRFVGGYLAVLAAMAVLSIWSRAEVVKIRVALRAASAAGLLVLGFITGLSIGLPLVAAGLLVSLALRKTTREVRSRPARLSGLVAAALSIAVLLTGIAWSQRAIVCPPGSNDAAGGSTLFLGSYQYQCVNGQLRSHS